MRVPTRLLLDEVTASSSLRVGEGGLQASRPGSVKKRGLRPQSFTEESHVQGQREELT